MPPDVRRLFKSSILLKRNREALNISVVAGPDRENYDVEALEYKSALGRPLSTTQLSDSG